MKTFSITLILLMVLTSLVPARDREKDKAFLESLKDPEIQRLNTEIEAAEAKTTALKAAKAELLAKKYPALEVRSPELASDKAAQALTELLTDDPDNDNDIGVMIRRSVKDKPGLALPALFQFSHSDGGGDSWSADAGIAIERDIINRSIGASIFAEYHYNDATGKLKDTLLAGAGLDFQPIDDQILRATGSYKRDGLVSGEGWLADLTWYPYFPQLKIGNNFGLRETNGWFEGRFVPHVGVQYEDGNGAEGFVGGDRFSFRAGVGLSARLAPKYFGNRLTLDTNLIYWNHFDTSGALNAYDDSQWYWVSALTYWLNTPANDNDTGVLSEDEQHFGISIGYTRGDNPDEGEFDADLFTAGFSVKF